jgi:hypothetical protein
LKDIEKKNDKDVLENVLLINTLFITSWFIYYGYDMNIFFNSYITFIIKFITIIWLLNTICLCYFNSIRGKLLKIVLNINDYTEYLKEELKNESNRNI